MVKGPSSAVAMVQNGDIKMIKDASAVAMVQTDISTMVKDASAVAMVQKGDKKWS